ncbi:GHMP kinase [Thermosediminibacter oceani]|uniref:GHMP kinase n=1 Tax=Thermosediminibacter oceani (strain ATCC BAA-1034 / DSM 16646 / JW/IW-1228P) TaxID=555079 RepID=D9RXV2_THEOJ|nr:GHMP kinase [Thermosediminibacter oceani]ADL08176.1 GHMP kinase [Thermosediminibacter oceani DSM 16646]
MVGEARCPASCGEIVQGAIGGRNFLITCPISLYSTVRVELIRGSGEKKHTANSTDGAGDWQKAREAIRKLLDYFGFHELDFDIRIVSQIPVGKGLSSSTADITAACLAAARALAKSISPDLIADIALSIEPSDGVMYRGSVIFDHLHGTWRESLGELPDMNVYIIDPEEVVDTESFNSRRDLEELNRKKENMVEEALYMTREAFRKKDIGLLGRAMIKSAIAHQEILYKPHLEHIINLSLKCGAVGVNVAHSGSAVGVFFEKGRTPESSFFEGLRRIMVGFGKEYRVIKTAIDNSGPRIL